jgi:hypothetical protein
MSIKLAEDEGFVHEKGLAYERLAEYHCYLGHYMAARPSFDYARAAYGRWGAHVLRIDELMRQGFGG